ncbi:hypothetical protein FRC02_006680, partial [Tulasnella sp. 418]
MVNQIDDGLVLAVIIGMDYTNPGLGLNRELSVYVMLDPSTKPGYLSASNVWDLVLERNMAMHSLIL